MKTFDTTPTADFLDAYRRVTGSVDTRLHTLFGAMLNDATGFEILRVHDKIMRAKVDQQKLTKLDEQPQFDDGGEPDHGFPF